MAKKVQDIASPAIISNMIFMADMARSTANRQDCSMYLNYAVRLMKQMMEEKNMKYQHIIFDLDGTLIDTEQAVLKTWQHTLKDFHYFFPLEELRIILGIPTENALKKLNVTVGPDFQDRWMENYTIYAGKAAFFPGVEHMLDVLRQRGHSLGIVTSRSREEYSRYFLPFRLESRFDRMIFSDNTLEHKPSPEPLYQYARSADVPLNACIYIGDMPTDIECANRAGVTSGLCTWNSSGILCRDAKLLFRTPEELCKLLNREDEEDSGRTNPFCVSGHSTTKTVRPMCG